MRQVLTALSLVVSMLASVSAATANPILMLKHSVVGCLDKSDLTRAASEPPNDGRCVRIEKGQVRIERVEGTYACVRRPQQSCLWVPSESIGLSILDDGAF
jgi:hypothetical protein